MSSIQTLYYLTDAQKWSYGMLASFGLSVAGFLACLILVSLNQNTGNQKFKISIKFCFSLACGTLMGDTLIHIMAQAYQSKHTNKIIVSLSFLFSIFFFIILQRLFICAGIGHNDWIESQNHNHNDHQDDQIIAKQQNQQVMTNNQQCFANWKDKGSFGYLNIIGSTLHNFIDSFTIGLAFSTGRINLIESTLIAIFSHQIPRQLGDVAILLQNGFNKKQALVSNGIINIISIIGTVFGLFAYNLDEQIHQYIMAFVGGNFIVISAQIWKNLFKQNWKINILEFFGLLLGVGIMILIKLIALQ